MALAAMLLSLSLFPWDKIQFLNDITETLVSSIQFPNRFLTIANVCLTAAAGMAGKVLLQKKAGRSGACYFGAMVVLLVLSSAHLLDSSMYDSQVIRVYNSEGMGTGYISGAEYLPWGADARRFLYHDPVCAGDVSAGGYEKLSLGARVCVDSGERGGSVAFPLLYYKG